MIAALDAMSTAELLQTHGATERALRSRGLARSGNSPLSDLAETLFCKAFGWTLAPASARAIDAVCEAGKRYQIKARRLQAERSSRQVSALRGLNEDGFDYLAGALFSRDYCVLRAAIVPLETVRSHATFQSHTNSARFFLRDALWSAEGVMDVTSQLREAAAEWEAKPDA